MKCYSVALPANIKKLASIQPRKITRSPLRFVWRFWRLEVGFQLRHSSESGPRRLYVNYWTKGYRSLRVWHWEQPMRATYHVVPLTGKRRITIPDPAKYWSISPVRSAALLRFHEPAQRPSEFKRYFLQA